MTRTLWVAFKAPAAERIVIHTFGSKPDASGVFDPLLAVYRGTAINNLSRIAGNDNKPLSGISTVDSLLQFNTVAGADYRVQIGSKKQIEGEISLNVFRFPPTGGLSAFLIQYNGFPFDGKDYSCELSTTTTRVFCNAKFIVHNSTNKTLTVTPSTTLGAGVSGPTAFSLAPGALKIVTFTFNAAALNKTARTVSGHFIFTGRTGATVVTEARHRALIIVRPSAPVDDLIKSVATPSVQTGYVNEPITFTSTITNSGPQTAIGCHFRSKLYSDLKTTFYRIDPATKERLTDDNVPVNIPAGQNRTFKVTVGSQIVRDATYADPEAIADCANNSRRVSLLRGGFDISASDLFDPLPSLNVTAAAPASGVLSVPRSGFSYFTFRATNTKTTAQIEAVPGYVRPYDDPANSYYTVAICRTNLSTGKCIGNYGSSVTYNATKGTVFGFSVRVKAPAGNPAFDPDKRRVHVNFKQPDAPYLHIAAPSIAVRKQ